MADPHEREQIARRYGFQRFAELLAISAALPRLEGDEVQAYLARSPDGGWFLWEDRLNEYPSPEFEDC